MKQGQRIVFFFFMLLCISFFFFGFSQKETSDLSDTPFTFALNENLYFLFSSPSVVFVVFVVAVELRLHLADSSCHYLRTERYSVCGCACACARSQKPFVQVSNKFHFSFRGNKSSTTITTIKRLMSRDIQLEPMTTDMLLHRYASSTDPARSTLGADSIK